MDSILGIGHYPGHVALFLATGERNYNRDNENYDGPYYDVHSPAPRMDTEK